MTVEDVIAFLLSGNRETIQIGGNQCDIQEVNRRYCEALHAWGVESGKLERCEARLKRLANRTAREEIERLENENASLLARVSHLESENALLLATNDGMLHAREYPGD